MSKRTIQRYKQGIKKFILFNPHVKYINDIKKPELLSWKESLKKQYRSRTVISYITPVKTFLKRASTFSDEVIHESEIGIIRIKDDCLKKETVTKEEMKLLIQNCPNTEYGIRVKLAFLILYNCGLRTGELLGLKISDFLKGGNYSPVFRTIISKGRSRLQYLSPITFDVLVSYIANRTTDSLYIFGSYQNPEKIMSEQSLYKIMRKVIKRAGIGKRITPYTFRRTCITNLAKGGMSLKEIALDKGNSEETIMRHYLIDNEERVKHRGSYIDMDF